MTRSPAQAADRISRIVVVNDLSKPTGGASLLALQSARAYAERGYPVTVIAGDAPTGDFQADPAIEWVHLGGTRLLEAGRLAAGVRGLYNLPARRLIADWIAERDRPGTVYHLHGWSQILSPSVFTALRPVQHRVIMTAHDFFLRCPNGAIFDYHTEAPCPRVPMSRECLFARCDRRSHAHKLWRSARHLVQERQLSRIDLPPQLLIHAGMAPFMRRAGVPDDRMAVLPNPVTPYSQTRIAAERNREVLFVGRIEATKGIDLAARACSLAGAKLVAVGDGAMLDELRAAFPEMRFFGRRTPAQIGPIATRARMLVMPSRHMEPFGLAAVEALGSGLPVIVSQDSLIADDVVAGRAGLAVDPRDEASFAAAVARLLHDDALTRTMSHAAYELAPELALSPAGWIDAMLEAYLALLAGGPPAVLAVAQGWTNRPRPSAARTALQPAEEPSPCVSM